MISSTRADLAPYRAETSRVITKLKTSFEGKCEIIETSMERAVQLGMREFAVAISKRWVEESDWVVLIVGWNYGTISDEAEAQGLGVTEWEYRHAEKLKKKPFVFLAGERGTSDEYLPIAGKEGNLASWSDDQTDAQREALKNFRKVLGKSFAAYFSNIDAFSDKLERTLRKAIEDLPPEVEPGTGLARLFLQVRPAIAECNGSIKSLTRCKEIHDALHDLLVLVIKAIRERVVTQWLADAGLSRENERILTKLDKESAVLLTKIRLTCFAEDFADAPDLLESASTLLAMDPLWDPPSEGVGEVESQYQVFNEKLNNFALAVQDAFTSANVAMLKNQRAFDKFHSELLKKIDHARVQQYLTTEEKATLENELTKVEQNKVRLATALEAHSDWQMVHDAMEGLFRFRNTETYQSELSRFLNKYPRILQRLTRNALVSITDDEPDEQLRSDLNALAGVSNSLAQGVADDQIDMLRMLFDACFYRVDKRTLAVVKRSRERVSGFEELLEILAKPAT